MHNTICQSFKNARQSHQTAHQPTQPELCTKVEYISVYLCACTVIICDGMSDWFKWSRGTTRAPLPEWLSFDVSKWSAKESTSGTDIMTGGGADWHLYAERGTSCVRREGTHPQRSPRKHPSVTMTMKTVLTGTFGLASWIGGDACDLNGEFSESERKELKTIHLLC